MEQKTLLDALVAGVGAGAARRVIVGLNWTLVEGPDGCGLTQTPERGTRGCHTVPGAGDFGHRPLRELAQLAGAANPFESCIGFAAINAFHNRYDLAGEAINGLDALGDIRGPVTAIGRFPRLGDRFPGVRVVEREPREGEYPEAEAEALIRESEAAIITASALANGTLGPLLAAAKAARVVLVGPSAPLAPCLHDHGVDVIAGAVVADIEGAARVIIEGGAVRALKPYCRFMTLIRPRS